MVGWRGDHHGGGMEAGGFRGKTTVAKMWRRRTAGITAPVSAGRGALGDAGPGRRGRKALTGLVNGLITQLDPDRPGDVY